MVIILFIIIIIVIIIIIAAITIVIVNIIITIISNNNNDRIVVIIVIIIINIIIIIIITIATTITTTITTLIIMVIRLFLISNIPIPLITTLILKWIKHMNQPNICSRDSWKEIMFDTICFRNVKPCSQRVFPSSRPPPKKNNQLTGNDQFKPPQKQ